MSECKKCNQPIEWAEKKDKSGSYPINPGTKLGQDNYFHSKTCGKESKPAETPAFQTLGHVIERVSLVECLEEACKCIKKMDEVVPEVTFTSDNVISLACTLYIQRNKR